MWRQVLNKSEKLKIIYEKIDSKMKDRINDFSELIKSKGYEYFSEYVHIEYQTRKASDLFKEMLQISDRAYTINSIWGINSRVKKALMYFIEDKESKTIKICNQCNENPVPNDPRYFAMCVDCSNKISKIPVDSVHSNFSNAGAVRRR